MTNRINMDVEQIVIPLEEATGGDRRRGAYLLFPKDITPAEIVRIITACGWERKFEELNQAPQTQPKKGEDH